MSTEHTNNSRYIEVDVYGADVTVFRHDESDKLPACFSIHIRKGEDFTSLTMNKAEMISLLTALVKATV